MQTKFFKLKNSIFSVRPTFSVNQVYDLEKANDILRHPKFDANRKTVLYVHGYIESPASESIHVIVNAYLKRNDHNIIILDWSKLADGNYLLDAVPNAKELGPKISEVLLGLFNVGLKLDKFHLVGHSLGGQMSGIIGRYVIKKSNKRITLPR